MGMEKKACQLARDFHVDELCEWAELISIVSKGEENIYAYPQHSLQFWPIFETILILA